MKALIALKQFIAAGSTHAPGNVQKNLAKQTQLLADQLLDELFVSLHQVADKTAHVHIYQRALQRLAIVVATDQLAGQYVSHALNELKEQLPVYFNWNEQAVCTNTLAKQFRSVLTNIRTAAHDPLWAAVLDAIDQDLRRSCCSWQLFHAIQSLIVQHKKSSLLQVDPIAFAVEFNLNDPSVKNIILAHFRKKIQSADTPALLIRLLIKDLNQLLEHNNNLPAPAPSLRQQLYYWLNEELQYYETTEPSGQAPATGLPPKISTPLSVAQFAAFIRLIIEAGIITCSNQRQLLSFIAAHIQTANANIISPQSLRNKYYGPELSTLSALKNICISMLNQARKMEAG